MRRRCNDKALDKARAATNADLRRFVMLNATGPVAWSMISNVEHMTGRPEHHVIQALETCGYRAPEIVENIGAVMDHIGRLH